MMAEPRTPTTPTRSSSGASAPLDAADRTAAPCDSASSRRHPGRSQASWSAASVCNDAGRKPHIAHANHPDIRPPTTHESPSHRFEYPAYANTHARHVSRETFPRRLAPAIALAALAAVALVACGGPPQPRGWASARPVELDGNEVVLVPHKGKVFALTPFEAEGFDDWRFPPRNNTERQAYPVSEQSAQRLKDMIDALSIESTAKKELETRVDDLRIAGNSKDGLKDAVDLTEASDDEKRAIKDLVDAVTEFENDAVRNLRAIYGHLGVSDDEGTVFVATFRGMIFALDTHAGTMRWIRDAGSEVVGGVAVDGDRLYVGTREGDLLALDARTGNPIDGWRFKASGEVWSTPVIDGDTLYFTSLDGVLYALDKESGDERWRFAAASSGIASNVAVADGTVFVGAFDNRLYAVNAEDGSMKWSSEGDNWFWATPLVDDGVVYAPSLDGKVYAVAVEDGAPVWEYDADSPIRSAPVIAGGALVVASRDARLHRLDLETGEPLEGSPLAVGDGEEGTVEADLTQGEDNHVYVVPRGAALYIYDAAESLRSLGGFPLPN